MRGERRDTDEPRCVQGELLPDIATRARVNRAYEKAAARAVAHARQMWPTMRTIDLKNIEHGVALALAAYVTDLQLPE